MRSSWVQCNLKPSWEEEEEEEEGKIERARPLTAASSNAGGLGMARHFRGAEILASGACVAVFLQEEVGMKSWA